MNGEAPIKSFFIGWDVGGWNCDNNPRSRDALVILNSQCEFVGKPWRGNLRKQINEAHTTDDWTRKLFTLCDANLPGESAQITMAIDTPLGFSKEFLRLATDLNYSEPIGKSESNCYLFRQTELNLFKKGMSPLSAVKDMIGSQATKGMHVLAKFAPLRESCGVWTNGKGLRAIEAYPASCKDSRTIKELLKDQAPLKPDDLQAAWVCGLVAYLYMEHRSTLEPPEDNIPLREGWIWVPRDAFDANKTDRGE